MQQLDYLTGLLGFQRFYVSGIETRQVKGIDAVVIDLQRQGNVYICSECAKLHGSMINVTHGALATLRK